MKLICSNIIVLFNKSYRINFIIETLLIKKSKVKYSSKFFNRKLIKAPVYNYDQFSLRLDFSFFIMFGRYIEYIRLFKYNEYLSIINNVDLETKGLLRSFYYKNSLYKTYKNSLYKNHIYLPYKIKNQNSFNFFNKDLIINSNFMLLKLKELNIFNSFFLVKNSLLLLVMMVFKRIFRIYILYFLYNS